MKFKLGERVVLYALGVNPNYRAIGIISEMYADGSLIIDIGNKKNFWAHPKQCRKIKVRERVWIKKTVKESPLGEITQWETSKHEMEGSREFREVRRK